MIQLTQEQQELVDLVRERRPRICLLTGGPGCGKTRTVAELLRALRQDGRSVLLTAPSGKAAQRMAEAIGGGAVTFTIHRALRMRPESNEWVPLQADVVVVDEASMVDVELFARLLKACFEGGGRVRTLLLVGDPHQLPPVGPGQPFHDLLRARTITVPSVRLTKPHRAAEGSGIVQAAYRIKDGLEPEWRPDFSLVTVDEAAAVPAAVADVLDGLALDRMLVQVLAPQRNHACGVEELNKHLEAVYAKAAGDPPAVRGFRPGSKVIHTKNDYDLSVFNGETGQVVHVELGPPKKDGKPNPAADLVVVEYPDGAGAVRTVAYKGKRAELLQHAWALTVHKSQGSEWPVVIFVAHRTHAYMLTRSLLYVATTRASKEVVVIGQAEAVAKAVHRVQDTTRRTLFQRWLGCGAA